MPVSPVEPLCYVGGLLALGGDLVTVGLQINEKQAEMANAVSRQKDLARISLGSGQVKVFLAEVTEI